MKRKRIVCTLLAILLITQITACAQTDEPNVSATLMPTAESTPLPLSDGENKINGTYTAAGNGNNGEVKVSVTFEDDRIVSIDVLEHQETIGIGDAAFTHIPEEIIAHQSIMVDAVTSATNTSMAIIAAVSQCISDAGGNVDDYSNIINKETSSETKQYTADVVVVGTGLSGITSAISAAENGASVIALEKASFVGGASIRASGGYMAVQIDENEEFHITDEKDSLDDFLSRWGALQDQSGVDSVYPDMDRVTYMFSASLKRLNWLQQYGIVFTPGATIAESHVTVVNGDAPDMPGDRYQTRVFAKLMEAAEALDVTFLYETPATEFLLDESKAVIGVQATSPDGPVEIHAQKVILACGSFVDNPEMVDSLIPNFPEAYTTSSANTGDGIRMAMGIGAALYDDQFPMGQASLQLVKENAKAEQFAAAIGNSLIVNSKGERFMNEACFASKQLIELWLEMERPYWCLLNGFDTEAAELAESGLASGAVLKGESLEVLSMQAGMEPTVLEAALTRYNSLAEKGADEDFQKNTENLIAYSEEGPFYLFKVLPWITDIMGGVETNYEHQVLREDGSIIDNLYAVGSMSNRPYWNRWYNSGSSLTTAVTSGQIAGAHAATHIDS